MISKEQSRVFTTSIIYFCYRENVLAKIFTLKNRKMYSRKVLLIVQIKNNGAVLGVTVIFHLLDDGSSRINGEFFYG